MGRLVGAQHAIDQVTQPIRLLDDDPRELLERWVRQVALQQRKSQLSVGLDKLNSTKQIVSTLKQQLAEQQPVLEATTVQVKESQVQIAADKEEAQVVIGNPTIGSTVGNSSRPRQRSQGS